MINKAIIVGNLGKDPEMTTLESGVSVTKFSVATTEKWTDKSGEKHEETEWHYVVLWRGLAEVAEKYLHKGDKVYIEGKIHYRQWEADGVTKYATEIVGNNMQMLGGKNEN
jgi:single-strand DNA-binding protein